MLVPRQGTSMQGLGKREFARDLVEGRSVWVLMICILQEQVGMVAINDAFLIESAIYKILKLRFSSKPYYVQLLELMHDVSSYERLERPCCCPERGTLQVTYETELGQMLDLITAPDHHIDLSKFTLEKYVMSYNFVPSRVILIDGLVARYKCIVKYKTAFYSFYLPVAMGMHMAGITDQKKFENALEILLEMGM